MITILLLLIAVSFILSLVGTVIMTHLSRRVGLVDHPGERKIHHTPTPKGGGVAFFLAIWLPIWLGVAACWFMSRTGWTPPIWPDVTEHIHGVLNVAPRLGIIFLGALVISGLGLVDDIRQLSPWTRLIAQTIVALGLVCFGISATLFIESQLLKTIITVLWVVGLVNAFNLLDNMDGLTAGVGAIIAFFFCIVAVQMGHLFIAAFLCCLIGGLGGFLIYNFPPASIFFGDSGATMLGYLLAVLTLESTFYQHASQPTQRYFPIIMPLLMFAMPLFDTITVVWIRLRAGRSPFQGDTNHFSHRLVALGMSRRQAVLAIYLVTATVCMGATILYYASSAALFVVFVQSLAIFTIIGILERARPDKATRP